jgi:hypothetical protein
MLAGSGTVIGDTPNVSDCWLWPVAFVVTLNDEMGASNCKMPLKVPAFELPGRVIVVPPTDAPARPDFTVNGWSNVYVTGSAPAKNPRQKTAYSNKSSMGAEKVADQSENAPYTATSSEVLPGAKEKLLPDRSTDAMGDAARSRPVRFTIGAPRLPVTLFSPAVVQSTNAPRTGAAARNVTARQVVIDQSATKAGIEIGREKMVETTPALLLVNDSLQRIIPTSDSNWMKKWRCVERANLQAARRITEELTSDCKIAQLAGGMAVRAVVLQSVPDTMAGGGSQP